MVAKSYQKYETCGEPFVENGRQYILLSTGKKVRWYEPHEYYKMYPDERPAAPNLKEVLGFDKGYVTICKGDQEPHTEWFKASDFRYSIYYGWYLCSTYELPEDFPSDLSPVRLAWSDISNPSGTTLKNEAVIKKIVDSLLLDPSPSEFYGSIGDRILLTLRVIKAFPLDGYYGRSTLHVFEDENKNIFIWTTGARTLEVGKTYEIKGSIKDHDIFRNCKQTILTRCQAVEKES